MRQLSHNSSNSPLTLPTFRCDRESWDKIQANAIAFSEKWQDQRLDKAVNKVGWVSGEGLHRDGLRGYGDGVV